MAQRKNSLRKHPHPKIENNDWCYLLFLCDLAQYIVSGRNHPALRPGICPDRFAAILAVGYEQ